MKKIFFKKFLFFLSFSFLYAIFVWASALGDFLNDLLNQKINPIICKILPGLLDLVQWIALAFFTIAGIKFLLAVSNPRQVERAKEEMMKVLIALFLIFALSSFLKKALRALVSGHFIPNIWCF